MLLAVLSVAAFVPYLVLQMEGARLSLKASEAVEIESQRVAIRATETVDVNATGDVVVIGKTIHLNPDK